MQIKGIFVFKPYQTGGEPAGNKKEDSSVKESRGQPKTGALKQAIEK